MPNNAQNTELDFEATLSQLENIVAQLETGELPLEEALKQFEQGVKLAEQGQARLKQAEQRIQILLQKSDTAELVDYSNNTHSANNQHEDENDFPF